MRQLTYEDHQDVFNISEKVTFLDETTQKTLKLSNCWFYLIGVFEISIDKKTPPTIKKVKRIGMIAGGTGTFNNL